MIGATHKAKSPDASSTKTWLAQQHRLSLWLAARVPCSLCLHLILKYVYYSYIVSASTAILQDEHRSEALACIHGGRALLLRDQDG